MPVDAPQAQAEDAGAEDLYSVVSSLTAETPTLSPIPVSKTPGTVSVITAKQIQDMGATTLDEVLAHMPGVDAYYSPMGFAGNIRGFGGSPFQEGVQYLIDGHLYNSPDKGGSSASPGYSSFPVPVEMIKQVEVIREPISALYGPNAFLGVINVITKKGADFNKGGTVVARAGGPNSGRGLQRYAAAYGRDNGKVGYALGGDFSREMGPTYVVRNSRIRNSQASANVRLNDFLLSWYNQNGDISPFPLGPQVGRAFTSNTAQQSINLAGMTYSKNLTDDVSLFSKSSFLMRRGSNCQQCHNSSFLKTSEPDERRESFYRIFQQFHTKIRTVQDHQITAGAEFMYDKDHMDAGVSSNPNVVMRTYSGFLQDMWNVTDEFSATFGARVDNSGWSTRENLTSPRALFVYTPTDKVTYRSGFTMAHRVPTFHDQHAFFKLVPFDRIPSGAAVNDFFITGTPTLKPETIQTFNLGTDRWLSNKTLVKINGFYSIVKNQIDMGMLNDDEFEAMGLLPRVGTTAQGRPVYEFADGSTGTVTSQAWLNNPHDAYVAGGELEFLFRPNRFLDMGLSYGYKNISFSDDPSETWSREESAAPQSLTAANRGGGHPANAPKHKATASMTLYPTSRLMCNVSARYRYKFYTVPGRQNQVEGLPAPYNGKNQVQDALLTDFHVRYAFPGGVKLSVLGRNVFNQRPREFYLREDTTLVTGRDFFAQLAYDFGGAE